LFLVIVRQRIRSSADSLFDPSRASNEHAPAPTISRKIEPSNIEKSVRASCAMLQKPYDGSLLRLNRQTPEIVRKQKLLNALREKNASDSKTD